jgi:hypothetical protein
MVRAGATISEYPGGRKQLFYTSNGTPFYSIGKIKARMKVDGGLTFVEREWEVSEKPLDFCEALIGRDLLHDVGRFVLFGAAGSPTVSAKPLSASRKSQFLMRPQYFTDSILETELQQARRDKAFAQERNATLISDLRAKNYQTGGIKPSDGASIQYTLGGPRKYGPVR